MDDDGRGGGRRAGSQPHMSCAIDEGGPSSPLQRIEGTNTLDRLSMASTTILWEGKGKGKGKARNESSLRCSVYHACTPPLAGSTAEQLQATVQAVCVCNYNQNPIL